MTKPDAAAAGTESGLDTERERLNSVSQVYEHLGSPIEHAVRRAALRMVKAHCSVERPSILELGCSDGYMTSLLDRKSVV